MIPKLTFMMSIALRLLLASLFLVPVTAIAQETIVDDSTGRTEYLRFQVGGYLGAGFNVHTANFGALPGVPSCCQDYKSAMTIAPALGLLIEFPIDADLHLQTRLGYTALAGDLSSTQVIGNEPVLDDGSIPNVQRQDVTVEHTLSAGLPMLAIEPILAYRFLKNFWASAGFRVGILMGTGFEQQETLISPDGYTFLDGTTVRNQIAQDIPDAQTIQMHASVGLGYQFPLSQRLSLVPEVRYYVPVTKISSVDWTVQTFQVGASVRYGIYTPKDPTIYRDTVYVRDTTIVMKAGLAADRTYLAQTTASDEVRDEADDRFITTTVRESWVTESPKPFTPRVAVDFVAIANGERRSVDSIRVEELDVIESYPLLPQIFYDSTNSDLRQTQQYLIDREQARDYSSDFLQRDQIKVYRNLLNIVGMRLRSLPTAVLTVTGTTDDTGDEKNNLDLAERRAQQVRDYLVDVWGVSKDQVVVRKRLLPTSPANNQTEEGRAENRRVELSANDIAVLEPVEFRQRDLVISPADFRLQPTVEDIEGIAEWEMSIKQGNTHLYTESGLGRPTPVRWDATNETTSPKNDKIITGTVTVRNALGQERSATDTLDVEYVTLQLMASREEGGKRIERYSLIVFDYNSAELNPANRRVMERIKSRIEADSKVKILGFADRSGNPEYNRNLARRRCLEAQRVLGLSDDRATIEPVGSDRLIYDNDTPEGRSYSRTVQIEVETPVR